NILDVADATNRSRTPGWSVHAAGIEFDHALLVRQAAQSHAGIVRIVFRTLHHAKSCVKRVAAVLQKSVRVLDIVESVMSRHHNRPLVGPGRSSVLLRSVSIMRAWGWGMRSDPGGNSSHNRSLYKITTRPCHGFSC